MNDTPTFTTDQQVESLAQAIHEGDWMMAGPEWRWSRATRTEQDLSYQRAHAVLAAHDAGARTAEEYAAVIAETGWKPGPGKPRRLQAKATKVVQWFNCLERGYLLTD